jgi:hypothetical protein
MVRTKTRLTSALTRASKKTIERYFLSGRFSRICNSRNCFGVTSDGAPIGRSSALVHREQHHLAQVLLAAEQHDDAVDAGRAMPPCGAPSDARSMPPNFASSILPG